MCALSAHRYDIAVDRSRVVIVSEMLVWESILSIEHVELGAIRFHGYYALNLLYFRLRMTLKITVVLIMKCTNILWKEYFVSLFVFFFTVLSLIYSCLVLKQPKASHIFVCKISRRTVTILYTGLLFSYR